MSVVPSAWIRPSPSRARATGCAALLATALLVGCGGGSPVPGEGSPPSEGTPGPAPFAGKSLLLVTVDTLRADRVGAYGDAEAHTPVLDSLAAEGVRFTDVYAPVPLTLPSHATLFTGLPPFVTGVHINGIHYLQEDEITLAERFREAGYATGAVVSAYVVVAKFGLAQGFDHYDDRLTMDDVFRFYAEIPAGEAVNRFAGWLDDLPAGKPFFGWLHLYDPHQPYAPPEPWASRFPNDAYRGEIAHVDAQLGALVDHLEQTGRAADTVLVLTSDHGEAFGEHGEEGHGLLAYDETLRVPLIVHAAGELAPRVVDARASLYDLTPTLTSLFGLEPTRAAAATGRDLTAALVGGAEPEDGTVYFETLAGHESKGWAPLTGLIAGPLKYVRLPEPELYDLAEDPGESRDLWSSRGGEGRAMDRRLDEWVEEALSEGSRQSERDLTDEDRRRLAALGYLGGDGGRGAGDLDPKRGIAIENRVRQIRTVLQAGDWRAADAALAELRRSQPDVAFSDFYELEFLVARARGDREAAVAALERGLAEMPEVDSLALRLATYREEIGDLEGAARDARSLLARDPRLSQAHSLLGLVAEKRGDPAAAITHFEAALALEPGSVPLRAKLAALAVAAGDLPRARSLYDQLLAEGVLESSPADLARSATLDAMLGDLPRAERTLRRVVALEPAGRHYFSLALILAQQRRAEEAAEAIEAALAADDQPLEGSTRALAEETLRQLRGRR